LSSCYRLPALVLPPTVVPHHHTCTAAFQQATRLVCSTRRSAGMTVDMCPCLTVIRCVPSSTDWRGLARCAHAFSASTCHYLVPCLQTCNIPHTTAPPCPQPAIRLPRRSFGDHLHLHWFRGCALCIARLYTLDPFPSCIWRRFARTHLHTRLARTQTARFEAILRFTCTLPPTTPIPTGPTPLRFPTPTTTGYHTTPTTTARCLVHIRFTAACNRARVRGYREHRTHTHFTLHAPHPLSAPIVHHLPATHTTRAPHATHCTRHTRLHCAHYPPHHPCPYTPRCDDWDVVVVQTAFRTPAVHSLPSDRDNFIPHHCPCHYHVGPSVVGMGTRDGISVRTKFWALRATTYFAEPPYAHGMGITLRTRRWTTHSHSAAHHTFAAWTFIPRYRPHLGRRCHTFPSRSGFTPHTHTHIPHLGAHLLPSYRTLAFVGCRARIYAPLRSSPSATLLVFARLPLPPRAYYARRATPATHPPHADIFPPHFPACLFAR